MALPFPPRFVQNPVRFVRGQALIPQVNGKPAERAQLGGECFGFDRSRTGLAGKVQRPPHHDARHAEASRQPRQRPQIIPRVALSFQREDGLHRQPQLIGYGDANALCAHIEAEITRFGRVLQRLFFPRTSLRPGTQDSEHIRKETGQNR